MNNNSAFSTKDLQKVQRWKAIQNIIEKQQTISRQCSIDTKIGQKKDDKSENSRGSVQIYSQELQNLQQVEQQQGQISEEKVLSLFNNNQKISQKKANLFKKVIQQTLKKNILNIDTSPSKQIETNLPSPNNVDNILDSANFQRDSTQNYNSNEEQIISKDQSPDDTELQNADDNVEDDGVYFKDFESMQGEYQIHAQEFLQLVNDPTYDPSEKLIDDQSTIYNKMSSFQSFLKQNIYNPLISSYYFQDNKKDPHRIQQGKDKNQYTFIISPDMPLRIVWDILCMLLIVYAIIMVPFRMSFDPDDSFTTLIEIDQIFDYIFMVDIVLNFNTAIYVMGNLIKERKVIALEYLKLWFWLDFFSCFPYDIIVSAALNKQEAEDESEESQSSSSSSTNSNSNSGSISGIKQAQQIIRMLKFFRLMKVLKLLRIAKLKLIVEKLVEYLKLSKSVLGILGFLKLSSIVLFIAHWIACMWHLIGSQNNEESWIIFQGLELEQWDIRYISSIYWAITTMVTVGYGDITPKNKEEKLFTIFIMLLACGIFAYTMNTMGTVLSDIESFSSEYKKEITSVNRYLDSKKVKLELKIRIRKYLEYIYESKQKNQIDETNLLTKLSSSLKNELIHQINEKVINNCYIFTTIFDKANLAQFLFQISINLQEKITIPEEIIIEQEDDSIEDDKSMYFIQDGEVEIFFQHSNKKTILKRLGAGSYFGELSFFTDLQRNASVQSVNFASLYYLKRSDFLKILQKFPNQREIFFEISDKIKNYQNYNDLNLTCFSCQKKGHIAAKCTNLSFSFFKSRYIEKLLLNYKNDQINFIRINRNRFRSILERHKVEEPSQKLQSTPLLLAYIRCYNIDREPSGERQLSILNKATGKILVDKVKQALLNSNEIQKPQQKKKQKQNQNQMQNNNHNNEYFIQMNYWKQVEEFDKIKIYERYFEHNNAKQGDSVEDQKFQTESIQKRRSTRRENMSEVGFKFDPLISARKRLQLCDDGKKSIVLQNNEQIIIQNKFQNEIEYSSDSSSSSNSKSSKTSSNESQDKQKDEQKNKQKDEENNNEQDLQKNKQIYQFKNKQNNIRPATIIEDNNEMMSSQNKSDKQQNTENSNQKQQDISNEQQKLFELINTQFQDNINQDYEDFNINFDSHNFNYDEGTQPNLYTERSKFKNQDSDKQNEEKVDNEIINM